MRDMTARRPFFEKRVMVAHEEINKRRKMKGWESSGIQHLSYDNRTTISLTIPFIAEMWFIDFYSLKGKHKN